MPFLDSKSTAWEFFTEDYFTSASTSERNAFRALSRE
jgi:hypothetical protein